MKTAKTGLQQMEIDTFVAERIAKEATQTRKTAKRGRSVKGSAA